MILIFSNYRDVSTSKVIKYLDAKGVDYLRINNFSQISEYYFSIENENDYLFEEGQVKAVWYRRHPEFDESLDVLDEQYVNIIKKEQTVLFYNIVSLLSDVYWLNHPFYASLNKLHVLRKAKECGLLIPDTIVTSKKEELVKFISRFGSVITKPLFEVSTILSNGRTMKIRTNIVDNTDMFPKEFSPSLFQKNIIKETEVRIVFLEGDFFSMSIFSQKNDRTKVDFRYQDRKNPIRYAPCDIPLDIKKKISRLFAILHLNFGSVDMIYGADGNLYFLEINPVGQFGMTSTPNNYNIEREVAKKLIEQL